jgi:predicted flap endonuclease-1-like 5' DNA nuclease
MFALIAKMLLCLLLAALIGLVMGWLLRGLRAGSGGASQEELDTLRNDLSARNERVASLEAQVANQQGDLDATRTGWDGEKAAAISAAAAAAAALAAAQSSLADREKAFAELEARHQSVDGSPVDIAANAAAEIATLRQRSLELEGELAAAQAASAGMASLRSELDASRQSLADLTASSQAAGGLEDTVVSLRQRITELESEIENLRRESGQTSLQLHHCSEARAAAEGQLATLTAEQTQLTARVAAFEKAEKLRLSKPPRQFYNTPAQVDDLEWIYGVGPKLAEMLNKLGVYQFRQVAMWNDEDIEFFDRQLEQFHGRIRRENWVQSAQEEQYKKYGDWVGEGEPTVSMPETGNRPEGTGA